MNKIVETEATEGQIKQQTISGARGKKKWCQGIKTPRNIPKEVIRPYGNEMHNNKKLKGNFNGKLLCRTTEIKIFACTMCSALRF